MYSKSTPLSLPSRSTVCEVYNNGSETSVYSGLENGNVLITVLANDTSTIKELNLNHNYPVSSISFNKYSGCVNFSQFSL